MKTRDIVTASLIKLSLRSQYPHSNFPDGISNTSLCSPHSSNRAAYSSICLEPLYTPCCKSTKNERIKIYKTQAGLSEFENILALHSVDRREELEKAICNLILSLDRRLYPVLEKVYSNICSNNVSFQNRIDNSR